MLEIRTICF